MRLWALVTAGVHTAVCCQIQIQVQRDRNINTLGQNTRDKCKASSFGDSRCAYVSLLSNTNTNTNTVEKIPDIECEALGFGDRCARRPAAAKSREVTAKAQP